MTPNDDDRRAAADWPVTRRAWWRLRMAWVNYRLEVVGRKQWLLRVRQYRLECSEPPCPPETASKPPPGR